MVLMDIDVGHIVLLYIWATGHVGEH